MTVDILLPAPGSNPDISLGWKNEHLFIYLSSKIYY